MTFTYNNAVRAQQWPTRQSYMPIRSNSMRTESLEALVPEAVLELEGGRADGPSVNRLARALIGPLRAFMRERGWGLEDPEHSASEALSLVLASLDKYDQSRGTLMSWVWGVARNHLHVVLRQKEKDLTPTKYETEHARLHHLPAISPAQRANLLAAVLGLQEDDYQLLFLSFIEKKDATEVSEILDLSAAVVRQRKRRLITRLKAAHKPYAVPNSDNL